MCRVSLAGSTVSFIKATAEGETGTVKLVYDGQTFFTTEITVAQKPLSKDDVTITGINDKYPLMRLPKLPRTVSVLSMTARN